MTYKLKWWERILISLGIMADPRKVKPPVPQPDPGTNAPPVIVPPPVTPAGNCDVSFFCKAASWYKFGLNPSVPGACSYMGAGAWTMDHRDDALATRQQLDILDQAKASGAVYVPFICGVNDAKITFYAGASVHWERLAFWFHDGSNDKWGYWMNQRQLRYMMILTCKDNPDSDTDPHGARWQKTVKDLGSYWQQYHGKRQDAVCLALEVDKLKWDMGDIAQAASVARSAFPGASVWLHCTDPKYCASGDVDGFWLQNRNWISRNAGRGVPAAELAAEVRAARAVAKPGKLIVHAEYSVAPTAEQIAAIRAAGADGVSR